MIKNMQVCTILTFFPYSVDIRFQVKYLVEKLSKQKVEVVFFCHAV